MIYSSNKFPDSEFYFLKLASSPVAPYLHTTLVNDEAFAFMWVRTNMMKKKPELYVTTVNTNSNYKTMAFGS